MFSRSVPCDQSVSSDIVTEPSCPSSSLNVNPVNPILSDNIDADVEMLSDEACRAPSLDVSDNFYLSKAVPRVIRHGMLNSRMRNLIRLTCLYKYTLSSSINNSTVIEEPTKVPGSNKTHMPRSVPMLPRARPAYVRRDGKPPRDGAGVISPPLHIPEWHGAPKDQSISHIFDSFVEFAQSNIFEHELSESNELVSPSYMFNRLYRNGHIVSSKSSPFNDEMLSSALTLLKDQMKLCGMEDDCTIAPEQPFRLKLLSALLKYTDDPDIDFMAYLERGVDMGDENLIKDVGLWPDKFEKDYDPTCLYKQWEENYKSAVEEEARLRKMTHEEVLKGFIQGPFTKESLLHKLGCTYADISIGRIGVICEDAEIDKWRIVYDATVSGQNPGVKLPETTEMPGLLDLLGTLDSGDWDGRFDQTIGLKIDIKSAFRRIKVLETERRKNVFKVGEEYYFYTVLPFGCKASAYLWQRIAGVVHRIMKRFMSKFVHAGWVYVDDSLWLLPDNDLAIHRITAMLLLLQSLGVPLSWNKTEFGYEIVWVGFDVDLKSHQVTIPSNKTTDIKNKLKIAISEKVCQRALIETLVGKLSWATLPWPLSMPFLHGLFQWIAAMRKDNKFSGCLPDRLKDDLKFWWWIIHQMPAVLKTQIPSLCSQFVIRTDARSTPPSIGGWCGSPFANDISQVRWFQYDIPSNFFDIICPIDDLEKRISVLELLAIVVGYRLWSSNVKSSSVSHKLSIDTDSMVSNHAICAWKSKTEPMVSLLKELSISIVKHDISVDIQHIPGDTNDWADGISRLNEEIMSQVNPDLQCFLKDFLTEHFWMSRGQAPWFRPS